VPDEEVLRERTRRLVAFEEVVERVVFEAEKEESGFGDEEYSWCLINPGK
jgi:hypothetical protein